LFSTTKRWPTRALSPSAASRAGTSVGPPPAGAGTTSFTGFAGYVCAAVSSAASARTSAIQSACISLLLRQNSMSHRGGTMPITELNHFLLVAKDL